MRALQLLQIFLEAQGIDLDARMASGRFISLAEIALLSRIARQSIAGLRDEMAMAQVRGAFGMKRPSKSVEWARARVSSKNEEAISGLTSATRLRDIRDYLEWLATNALSRIAPSSPAFAGLAEARNAAIRALNESLTVQHSGGARGQREGISHEEEALLLEVVEPCSHRNPWKDEFTKYRNYVAVLLLHRIGLRRGELSALKVEDIDFRRGVLSILRRPDDPDDPRKRQPLVKTRAREIPLAEDLLNVLLDYVVVHRRAIKGARRHPFLLVASRSGAPLSSEALDKSFSKLRQVVPGLPNDLSAHVLRHTWNDRFSEEMDRHQVPEAEEQAQRSYLMGWAPTSGTAATYTKRHVRTKAQAASLELQRGMSKGRKNK